MIGCDMIIELGSDLWHFQQYLWEYPLLMFFYTVNAVRVGT